MADPMNTQDTTPRALSPESGTLMRRFSGKYAADPETGCWLWTGHTRGDGYGGFWAGGKTRRAHRVAYELFVGTIPEGLTIDHLCRHRRCVNPEHLEPVTKRENTLRGVSPAAIGARRTHCLRHPELPLEKIGNGHRNCRVCYYGSIKASGLRRAALRRENGAVS